MTLQEAVSRLRVRGWTFVRERTERITDSGFAETMTEHWYVDTGEDYAGSGGTWQKAYGEATGEWS